MYKIKTYNKISKSGLEVFDEKYTIGDEVENADGAIVRSAALHDTEFPASLKAIARAGAGTNNIPIDRCSEQGIVVFNTPGANANAVKELVVAGLMSDLSAQEIASLNEKVRKCVYNLGVSENVEPFMNMAFVSLLVIPSIKMSTNGLIDVNKQETISLYV